MLNHGYILRLNERPPIKKLKDGEVLSPQVASSGGKPPLAPRNSPLANRI